jgi:hypothetical protein
MGAFNEAPMDWSIVSSSSKSVHDDIKCFREVYGHTMLSSFFFPDIKQLWKAFHHCYQSSPSPIIFSTIIPLEKN